MQNCQSKFDQTNNITSEFLKKILMQNDLFNIATLDLS